MFQDEVRIDLADHRGNTPLKLAKGRKYKSLVEYLQQQQDKNVMSACNVKYVVVLHLLIQRVDHK